jgi:hypothetical protein
MAGLKTKNKVLFGPVIGTEPLYNSPMSKLTSRNEVTRYAISLDECRHGLSKSYAQSY